MLAAPVHPCPRHRVCLGRHGFVITVDGYRGASSGVYVVACALGVIACALGVIACALGVIACVGGDLSADRVGSRRRGREAKGEGGGGGRGDGSRHLC